MPKQLAFTAGPYSEWRNKTADNPSHFLPLNNGGNPSVTFDVDLSRGALFRADFFLSGVLNTAAGGGADPVQTTDRALRQFQIEAWLERKNGGANIQIFQPGTPLVYAYRVMQAIAAAMRQVGTPGAFADQSVDRLLPFSYRNVLGTVAATGEQYGIHFPFFPAFLGGLGTNFLPGVIPSTARGPFSALRVKFTNVVSASSAHGVAPGIAFPSSTRIYTYTGIPGYTQAGVECRILLGDEDRIPQANMDLMARMVPTYRLKSLPGFAGGVAPDPEYTLSKFDRSQMVQGVCIFEESVTTVSGATENGGTGEAIAANDPATILRDFTVLSNGTILSEYNLLMEAHRQNTRSVVNNAGITPGTRLDQSPIVILHSVLGEPGGMNDYRKYFAENADVIYSFENLITPGAGTTRYVRALNFGYQEVQ